MTPYRAPDKQRAAKEPACLLFERFPKDYSGQKERSFRVMSRYPFDLNGQPFPSSG
ncbi:MULTISPECIES: hypothetical protein [Kordiimonas]|uniref:hypothetical protein n=1 Tax=Kordiimonas TaxID=288021 RepID=UPI001FF5D32D|nr:MULTISPECIES: hypothetical protein [Kordiimonas]MCK0070048.1 hypothetical protein [Kordiimonas laminariae]UTW59191.1 hypothetical protein KFE96_02460 [Kordiimonas sp. SCSIO 12603]